MIKFSKSKSVDIHAIRDFYCNYATWKVNDDISDWEKIIENSSCIITAWKEDELIGAARGLSDEVRWATIIDVLVHPDYRAQGIGRSIVEKLLGDNTMKVRTVYLATPDKEKFYNNLGFKTANEHCSYMIKVNLDKDEEYFLPQHK
ncbi:MAG: GNAT family N-acetyltransferase [Paraclostridium sp.]